MLSRIQRLTLPALVWFFFGVSLGCAQQAATSSIPYPETPWQSNADGQCGTGLAFADINGDGWQDMVVSNGNDIAQQKLAVYYNRKDGTFPKSPSWTSKDDAFNGNLSVGDVDGDGWPDVAVSVYTGPEHTYSGGGAKLYRNKQGELEDLPCWAVTGFPSFSVVLGDANGDGALDLAVAAGNPIAETETFAAQPDCKNPHSKERARLMRRQRTGAEPVQQEPPFQSNGFIFYNEQDMLSPQPGWISSNKMTSMSAAFADVNKDGHIDLIQASPRVTAYFGDGSGKISRSPSWTATDTNYFSNQLGFAGTLNTKTTNAKALIPSIMVANNNYMGGGDGKFNLFRFTSSYVTEYNPTTSRPSWSSPQGGWGSGSRFADINGDGYLDLLAGRWAPPGSGVLGAPLEIYIGDGLAFEDKPAFVSKTSSVMEIIAVADLGQRGLTKRTETFKPQENERWSVLTLTCQNPQKIDAVLINGKKLPATAYKTVVGDNVIYLKQPIGDDATVEVSYRASSILDIGVTNWDCNKGNYIFHSQAKKPGN